MTLRPDEKAEPIAIVGIGCRFPGAPSSTAFWDMLCRGEDRVTEFPADRFDAAQFYDPKALTPGKSVTKWGAFLDRVDGFDWRAFAISPREAESMDPQHRLLLEVAWEALEDAGAPLESVAGSRTGVVLGLMLDEYRLITRGSLSQIDGYTVASNVPSFAANRISFLLDLHGASLTLDASCASSLVALHLACELIRSGELEGALVGAASLLLAPDPFISLSRASALSPTGHCRALDSAADGFVRGEGAGVLYLKPLRSAVANNDRIYAIISGTASAHKGAGHWIQEPSRASQEAVIREALRKAGLSGKDLDYVELHGTGTPRGDPEEARALGAVVSEGRDATSRCVVGSVKTNIGHLDPAAGIAGVIKVALAIHHGAIPPSLHFTNLNPAIDVDALHLEVGTKLTPWPKKAAHRTAGVTSIGFGGVCGHAVLQSPPVERARQTEPRKSFVLPLSARSAGALRELADDFASVVEAADPQRLTDLCYTMTRRRTHHEHRLCVIGESGARMAKALSAHARGQSFANLFTGQVDPDRTVEPLVAHPSDAGLRGEAIARLYCEGQSVDWSSVYPEGKVLSTPAYHWQRERLWLDTPAKYGIATPASPNQTKVHPFLTASVELADPASHVWEGRIDLTEHPYFLEHRPQGKAVLPAAAFIEAMLSAASKFAPVVSLELRDISFHKPVLVSAESVVRLSLTYTPSSSGQGGAIRLFSNERASWVENVTAVLAILDNDTLGESVDVPALEGLVRASGSRERAECYEEIARKGLQAGATFQRIACASQRDETVIGKISNIGPQESAPFLFHPAVQDACMHLMLLSLSEQPGAAYMPVGIRRLRLLRSPGPGDLWSKVAVEVRDEGGSAAFVGRAEVFDGDGSPVLQADGVELAQLNENPLSSQDALDQWCSEVEWLPASVTEAAWKPTGTWVVWLDHGGFGTRFAQELSSAGCKVIEVVDRVSDASGKGRAIVVQGGDLESLRREVESLLDSVPDLAGFVYLGGLNTDVESVDVSDVQSEASKIWLPALAIAQSLLVSSLPYAKLWLVTHGVHGAGSPVSGALWGLGRSLVFDLSSHWGGLIDLEDDLSDEASARGLLAAIAAQVSSGEEVVLRDGHLLCSRLVPAKSSASGTLETLRLSPDGLYVITGGLGGLGLCAAQRLVDRGARHLALVGRTPLPDRDDWERMLADPNGDRRLHRQLRALIDFEARGVDAQVHILDAGDLGAFAFWLRTVRASTGLPLRGFVHAAGVFDVQPLEELTGAAFMQQMRPKCMPLFALERVLPAEELEFVALFSSAASVVNSPRVAHYAAANAFLDSFALRMRAKGVHALSLNWGLWSDVGFIEKLGDRSGPGRLQGSGSIPPRIGMDLFEHFLANDATQVLIWPTDWDKWAKTYPSLSSVPLFSQRVRAVSIAPGVRGGDDEWLDRFVRASSGDRAPIVLSFLRRQVEGLLHLPLGEDEDTIALEDLGLDSLLSIELRTHVQRAFRVDLSAFEFQAGATLKSATDEVVKSLGALYPELLLPPPNEYEVLLRHTR